MKRRTALLLALMVLFGLAAAVAEQPKETAADPSSVALEERALPIDDTGGVVPNPAGYIGPLEYADPTIRVSIETGRANDCDYWIADIRIGHASQLRTAAADSFKSNMELPGPIIAQRVNAVLALNGDFFSFTRKGFIVRQGVLYKDKLEGVRDVLLIDEAGDFHFIRRAAKNKGVLEIDGKKVINAFFFGPVLVENGKPNKRFGRDEMYFLENRQRMCIAQAGPLHYKVICCAAAARGSAGMTMRQFAQFVYETGVPQAYNLDGGDSTMLLFNGAKVNDPTNPKPRDIVDIIYFASSAAGM